MYPCLPPGAETHALRRSSGVMRGVRTLRWLRERWIELKKRFAGVTESEKWGYGVWGAMGVVFAVPELCAVGQGCDFPWPTISTTIGHLLDKAPVVALIPVALIVMAGFFVFRLNPSRPPQIANDRYLIVRTPEGRRAKLQFVSYEQLAPAASASGKALIGPTRTRWRSLPYFVVATCVVIVGFVIAIPSGNRYLTGYVGYSLIAVFWVIVPSVAAYWLKKDVPFTTLVYTVGILGRRLPIVAALTASLLVILLLHLALYPWPSTSQGEVCGIAP